MILKNLNPIDAFYSLFQVNQRFHRLLLDPQYAGELDWTTMMNTDSKNGKTSIDIQFLPTLFERIFPQIRPQLQKLFAQTYLWEQAYFVSFSPSLYSLLQHLNVEDEALNQYFEGIVSNSVRLNLKVHFFCIQDNPVCPYSDRRAITTFCIHLITSTREMLLMKAKMYSSKMSPSIPSSCEKLTIFNFHAGDDRMWCPPPVFLFPQGLIGSTLTELKMNVECFCDWLHLLDGSLDSLSTLMINVSKHVITSSDLVRQVSIFQ